MKSYGPPSLITIANHRLIDIQIEAIGKTFKYYEIILCVGFDAEKISKYVRNKYNNINIRIVENQLYNSSNSCESARLALNNTINDQILICDGNLLINSETLSLVNDEHSTVILESNPCSNLEVGVNVDEKNEAQHFSFGASNIWSEILYLNNQEIIESLRRIMCGTDYKSRFIFEALNELIKTKHKLKCVTNEHSIKKINNVKTYHAITR
jgi:NDP-sugar pyrophosphorylase family protein